MVTALLMTAAASPEKAVSNPVVSAGRSGVLPVILRRRRSLTMTSKVRRPVLNVSFAGITVVSTSSRIMARGRLAFASLRAPSDR